MPKRWNFEGKSKLFDNCFRPKKLHSYNGTVTTAGDRLQNIGLQTVHIVFLDGKDFYRANLMWKGTSIFYGLIHSLPYLVAFYN